MRSRAVLLSLALVSAASPKEQSFLDAHNRLRGEAAVPSLKWNAELALQAARWAKTLADTDSFKHSDNTDQGENLWIGTVGAFSPEEMVETWAEEKENFRAGRFPNVSRTGIWSNVGHYTQIIWSKTTDVGCAVASNAKDDVLVCRYIPAGNIMGAFVGRAASASAKKVKKRGK